MTDTIHCFHQNLGVPHFNALVPYWEHVWRLHGWKTRVMTLNDAKKHPLYEKLFIHAKSLPTINRGDFNWLNCVRWLAFAQVNGAVADYDVFPRIEAYPPRNYPERYCADPQGGPGFVVGTGADFLHIANRILSYVPKPTDISGHYKGEKRLPHVSDMIILHQDNYLSRNNDIACYGTDGWRSRDLVHFGNSYMKRPWGQKVEEIRDALKEEKAPY